MFGFVPPKPSLMILIFLFLIGCKSVEKEVASSEGVTGTYVHSYSAEVIDPTTGEVMGTRMVRDTIFIKESGDKFEVANRKWMDNDYDNDGWLIPESESDRGMPTYLAEFDTTRKRLHPVPKKDGRVDLYVDGDKIYWGEERALTFERVEE
jgi:hypothetical protein